MTTTLEDIAWDDAMEQEYQANLVENITQEVSTEAVKAYLASYGDAIHHRVRSCQEDADRLFEQGMFSHSLVASAIAMELTLRQFLLRPLVQGAILRTEWAAPLVEQILWGQCTRYRNLLPKIAVHWGIDVHAITLADGTGLWPAVGDVWEARNRFVHAADPVSQHDAARAIECVSLLISAVLVPLAHKVGLSWPDSGAWSQIKRGIGGGLDNESVKPENPFGSEK